MLKNTKILPNCYRVFTENPNLTGIKKARPTQVSPIIERSSNFDVGIISGCGKQTATPLSCGRNFIKFYDVKFFMNEISRHKICKAWVLKISTRHLISGEYCTENEQCAKNREKENL